MKIMRRSIVRISTSEKSWLPYEVMNPVHQRSQYPPSAPFEDDVSGYSEGGCRFMEVWLTKLEDPPGKAAQPRRHRASCSKIAR